MGDVEKTQLNRRMAQLEELWAKLDDLCDSLRPDEWLRPHGEDWTLADAPYHTYFFDQEFIADAMVKGPNVPLEQQIGFRTMREMSQWNQAWFAKRPAGQTPAQSLAQMRSARQAIRQVVATFSDADLDRPVWFALVSTRGWRTLDFALWVCLIHTWIEFMELRHYARRHEPDLSPQLTHVCIDGYLQLVQVFFDRTAAAHTTLHVLRRITGNGGGEWTIGIQEGSCTIQAGRAEPIDLVITQSTEQLVAALLPIAVWKRGEGEASDPATLARLSQLFPPPAPDQVLEPLP